MIFFSTEIFVLFSLFFNSIYFKMSLCDGTSDGDYYSFKIPWTYGLNGFLRVKSGTFITINKFTKSARRPAHLNYFCSSFSE